jgi:hypothetical protein
VTKRSGSSASVGRPAGRSISCRTSQRRALSEHSPRPSRRGGCASRPISSANRNLASINHFEMEWLTSPRSHEHDRLPLPPEPENRRIRADNRGKKTSGPPPLSPAFRPYAPPSSRSATHGGVDDVPSGPDRRSSNTRPIWQSSVSVRILNGEEPVVLGLVTDGLLTANRDNDHASNY